MTTVLWSAPVRLNEAPIGLPVSVEKIARVRHSARPYRFPGLT